MLVLKSSWSGAKPENQEEITVRFDSAFASPPVVVVCPHWNSPDMNYAAAPETITYVRSDRFVATSVNYGPGYQIAWIAMGTAGTKESEFDAKDGAELIVGDKLIKFGAKAKYADGDLQIDLQGTYSFDGAPVVVATPHWDAKATWAETVKEVSADQVTITSGNYDPDRIRTKYYVQWMAVGDLRRDVGRGDTSSANQSDPIDIEIGRQLVKANSQEKTDAVPNQPIEFGGQRFRSGPVVVTTPRWNKQAGTPETVRDINRTEAEVLSNNYDPSGAYLINWIAVGETTRDENEQNRP